MLQIAVSLWIALLGAVPAMAEPHYWGGQRVVTQIAQTSAYPLTGDFGVAGADFWTRYTNYMNANGCATADGWYPCTISNIREAMANQVSGWNTITWCSWINAFDTTPAHNYSTGTTSNCAQWTSGLGTHYGMVFCPPQASTGNDAGFLLTACNSPRGLLCCK